MTSIFLVTKNTWKMRALKLKTLHSCSQRKSARARCITLAYHIDDVKKLPKVSHCFKRLFHGVNCTFVGWVMDTSKAWLIKLRFPSETLNTQSWNVLKWGRLKNLVSELTSVLGKFWQCYGEPYSKPCPVIASIGRCVLVLRYYIQTLSITTLVSCETLQVSHCVVTGHVT